MTAPWFEAVQVWPAEAGALPLIKRCGHKHKSIETALLCVPEAGRPKCGFTLEVRTAAGEVVKTVAMPYYQDQTGVCGAITWKLRTHHADQPFATGKVFTQEWWFTYREKVLIHLCQPIFIADKKRHRVYVTASKIEGGAWLLDQQVRVPGKWSEVIVMAEEIPVPEAAAAVQEAPPVGFFRSIVGEA